MTLSDVQVMTPKEKQVKLAELLGVTCRRCKGVGSYLRYGAHAWFRIGGGRDQPPVECDHSARDSHQPFAQLLPDYCHDLNVVHEVEKTLSAWDRREYLNRLEEIAEDNVAFLTAEQRATMLIGVLAKL